ncbi:hypothetical protein MNBD_ALPHA04-1597 [hydrothermal vent metagenome]|uniref:DUF4878 domain-containing protein n=1 Tax=hydrothermal vent metagenome TaxID=652676 RepID=A0A3B0R4L7_9ZZZZ
MKTWMKVVLGIFAGIALLLALIFWLTGDVTKAGDDFFGAVQNDDIDSAYELLSDDFKAGTSKADLASYLKANALDKISDVSWGGRMIQNNIAKLDGTVETKSGDSIPLALRLVKGKNGWKIQSIRKDPAGFNTGHADIPIPSIAKQTELVKETVAIFAQSLADKDMTKLYDNSSPMLRQQVSFDKFNETYGYFFQFAPGYAAISKQNPVLDEAVINKDTEILTIKSHYPVKPSTVYFDTLYAYEGTDWKFAGLVIEIGSKSK